MYSARLSKSLSLLTELRPARTAGDAGLNTYVVCPGLLYGAGEMAAGLFPLFQVSAMMMQCALRV